MLSANQITGFIKIQYLTKEVNDEVYFWQADKHRSLLEVDTSILGLCQKYPKNTQSTQNSKFAISLQYLQKEVNDELIVCMEISIEACYIILWFWSRWSSIPKVVKIATFKCLYSISKKKVRDHFEFLHQVNNEVDFNTLGIKVSYKAILLLLMGMIKDSQSNKIFTISQRRS